MGEQSAALSSEGKCATRAEGTCDFLRSVVVADGLSVATAAPRFGGARVHRTGTSLAAVARCSGRVWRRFVFRIASWRRSTRWRHLRALLGGGGAPSACQHPL